MNIARNFYHAFDLAENFFIANIGFKAFVLCKAKGNVLGFKGFGGLEFNCIIDTPNDFYFKDRLLYKIDQSRKKLTLHRQKECIGIFDIERIEGKKIHCKSFDNGKQLIVDITNLD